MPIPGLAKYGTGTILPAAGVLVLAAGVLLAAGAFLLPAVAWAAIVPALLLVFVLYFFRDPPRTVPAAPGLLVSPADGKVTHVEEVEEASFLGGRALRISIFLSIFDVHLNRAPCAGTVIYRNYRSGGFLNAMRAESGHANEANDLGLETGDPRLPKVLVRQIAGAIARRIVCEAETGAALERGQIFGMIKFGSRTDLFVPLESGVRPRVAPGDTVRAGSTVVGELP